MDYKIQKIWNTNLKGLEESLNEHMKAHLNWEIITAKLSGHYELSLVLKRKEED